MSIENGNTKNIQSTGTLKDSAGNCYPDSVVGTFYNGVTPGPDTAYVLLQVNVKSTGSYSITTDMQNGFSFSDSGYFSTIGINTIKLKPEGRPILPIVTDFTVSYDTSVCMFSINVKDSTGTGIGGGGAGSGGDTTGIAVNSWAFESNSHIYSGPVTTAVFDTTIGNLLSITGNIASGIDSLILINVTFPTTTIDTGTYITSSTGNNFLFATSMGNTIFTADASTGASELEIHILNYDSGQKIVTGTFFGTANDNSGNPVNITKGVFKAKHL